MIRMECPECGKRVAVHDPGPQASAWFVSHFKPSTRERCSGSMMTAINRTPRGAQPSKGGAR